jgi:hypothetical protein
LIESGPRAPFVKQIVKKFFACADVACARDINEISMRASEIFSNRCIDRAKTRMQKVLMPSDVLQYLRYAALRAARCWQTRQRCARTAEISTHCVADDARKRLQSLSHCFFHFAGVNDM